ncbi:MAG: NUDIX domain-containing protein, partial [Pseudomonadota bacterium]
VGICDAMPTIRQPFSRADVEEIETVEIYREYFTMQDRTVRFSTYDGGRSAPVKRGVFISGEAVTVLPYDAARDEVLLIEQWRVGPWVYGDANPWAIEVIAGRLEGDTHPERTARREAREEAGVEIAEMEHAAGYYTTPGIGCEYLTSYVGRADLSAAGGVHGLEEEGENIRVITLGFWDAMEALARGDVNTAPAVLSLLWLARNRERLRLLWS